MARRKAAGADDGGALLLPKHLVDYTGGSAADFSQYHLERRQWFAEHGLSLADWDTVRRLEVVSRAAHGLPDRTALTRARLKVKDDQ